MSTATCPACGQALPGRKGRICGLCEKPIRRHDRYLFVGSVVQHRDCLDTQLAKATASIQQQQPLLEETA